MQSMTGYGTATGSVGHGRLIIEIKTLNHRYCELFFKIPSRMGSLESALRENLQSALERGKIEFFLRELEPIFGAADLALNVPLAKKYQKALHDLQKALKIKGQADPLASVGIDHFVSVKEKEGNYLSYSKEVITLMRKALAQVQKMRAKEGAYLLQDQKKRLKDFMGLIGRIAVLGNHNFKRRLNASLTGPQENGGGTNAVTKTDIAEELTRLQSHTQQYAALIRSKEPIGRKLDFLVQEMHRELNTIGAKAADAKVSQYIVESKSLLETLREQVQNIL